MDFRRGRTSKNRLLIEWTYPVWKPPAPNAGADDSNRTVAVIAEHALSIEQAYELITGGDTRPLLVLRECEKCKGTDHALLNRDLDNEQTVLLTHWFRCVKLPPNVLDEQHPFFNLFKPQQDGTRIPHLFLCSHDGSNKMPLPGDQTQAEVWEAMFSVLEREYQGDAKKAVKELRALLSQFDNVDAMERDLKARLDKEVEKNGPESDKAKKYQTEIADLQKDRNKLFAKERQIRTLARKQQQAAGQSAGQKAPVPADAGK